VILALNKISRWLWVTTREFGVSENRFTHPCGILMNTAQSRLFPNCLPFLKVVFHCFQVRLIAASPRQLPPVSPFFARPATVSADCCSPVY
jgi:hypothetical protein